VTGANETLERLLRRGESARLRGVETAVSLSMTSKVHAPEYIALRSLDDIEHYHAQIALAEREGAINVQRDRHHGDGQKLLRIGIADLGRLAASLGVRLADEKMVTAARILEPWGNQFPITHEILELWRQGRKVRGYDSEAARDLADAASFIAMRMKDSTAERVMRKESVKHFGDSKRLEKLTAWLDVLVSGQLNGSGLQKEEVWSAIGLRREPQPFLLAGTGKISITDQVEPLPLIRPYLGLAPESITSFSSPARYVLTIENLASFHDALAPLRPSGGLLIYTGGMPSPAWKRAYLKLLGGLSKKVPVFHWGDIDQGGFRIAAAIVETAASIGRKCQPWLMSPAQLSTALAEQAVTPPSVTLVAMKLWAERAGWQAIAKELGNTPILLEQEAIDALPPLP